VELNLAAFLLSSRANGPGERAVIWVQGCPRCPPCPGCCNPQMQDPAAPAERVAVEELERRVAGVPGLAGVTLSGGEPFHQAGPLAELARRLRARGLSVVAFSGYAREELESGRGGDWLSLLAETDLLVDGPFRRDLPAGGPLRSSANQRLHLLSGRIRSAAVEHLPAEVEVLLDPSGDVVLTGAAAPELAPSGGEHG
jgi:anaerobic ribonucleoside-triphosphate reductase activating protein